jgi:hypothetical protein
MNNAQIRTAGCPAAVAEAAFIASSRLAILEYGVFTDNPKKYL